MQHRADHVRQHGVGTCDQRVGVLVAARLNDGERRWEVRDDIRRYVSRCRCWYRAYAIKDRRNAPAKMFLRVSSPPCHDYPCAGLSPSGTYEFPG